MSTPRVSVIIPLHDGERHLAEALDSVAAQEHPAAEVIVVDNGSRDGGAELARARGATVVVEPRPGVAFARNTGVQSSRGEILAFLDQDDVWLPAKLRRQVALLSVRPDCVAVVRQQFFLDGPATPPAWLRPELLQGDHPGLVPSCLAVTRKTFDRVGPFDPAFTHGSDSDWLARARDAGVEIVEVMEALVRRRVHDANESGSTAALTDLFGVLRGVLVRRRGTASDAAP